jgi:hypothetical protein
MQKRNRSRGQLTPVMAMQNTTLLQRIFDFTQSSKDEEKQLIVIEGQSLV